MPPTRIGGRLVKDGGLTDADVAPSNKDGASATPSMRTLGTGAQQSVAGDDDRLIRSPYVYQHTQGASSPPGPRFYAAGQMRAGAGIGSGIMSLNVLYLMPVFTGEGSFRNLGAIGLANTTAPVGSTVQFVIYMSISSTDLYPGTLLAQTGSLPLPSVGPPYLLYPITFSLPANSLLWLGVLFGGSAPTCRTLNVGSCYPILGMDTSISGTNGVGYRANWTAGTPLPNPMTAGLATAYSANGQPMIIWSH